MRHVLLLLTAALLLGCTSSPQAGGGEPSEGIPGLPGAPAEECTPAYSFSELDDGVLSKDTELVATVSCAGGKRIAVKLDGEEATALVPETNATQPLTLVFGPKTDGTLTVTVEVDGQTVHSREWEVAPLGNDDVSGVDNDAISFKEYRAMAVDVENPIDVGQVRIFMKRLDFRSQEGTQLLVELRDDDSGNPGSLVAEARRPIEDVTLSENWISFDYDASLSPGTYWIVMKVEQTEGISTVSDKANIHYVTVDRLQPGNDYTRVMKLSVDEQTGLASETTWEPLPYDRAYSVVLTN